MRDIDIIVATLYVAQPITNMYNIHIPLIMFVYVHRDCVQHLYII